MAAFPEPYSIFLKQLLYLLCRLVTRTMQLISRFPITHQQGTSIQSVLIQTGAFDVKMLIFLELITNMTLSLDAIDTNMTGAEGEFVPASNAYRHPVAPRFGAQSSGLAKEKPVEGPQSVDAGHHHPVVTLG